MNKLENKLNVGLLGVTTMLLLFSVFAGTVDAQESKEAPKKRRRSTRSLTRQDSGLLSVFKPVAVSANDSTVKVLGGRRQIAVGTIVGSDGLVLTKASEMKGDLKCKLPDGSVKAASVMGVDVENDLALLKVDVEGLAVAPLRDVPSPKRGSWLISPTDGTGAIAIGVVGVEEREIPKSKAFIGINMIDVDLGVKILRVVPNTPAERAGLKPEDVILKLDSVTVKDSESLRKTLEQYSPESQISITIRREDNEKVVRLTLADARTTSPQNNRSLAQNSMGSRLSRRSMDFPSAFQHDTALQSFQCGGPVIDVDGKIVGINIARAGRVSSLAIPASTVLEVIDNLKTGEYSPVAVYADQIKFSETELKQLKEQLAENKQAVEEKEEGFYSKSAKIEELERMRKEISKRISEMYKERENLAKTKKSLIRKNEQAEKDIRKSQMRLDALKSGKRY
jgi:serine protease Do